MNDMTDFSSTGGAGRTLRDAPPHRPGLQALARGLGFFSLALGLAELAAPRQVARVADMGDLDGAGGLRRLAGQTPLPSSQSLVRGYGLRELGAGAGLLASADPEPWVWGRVAGDVLDIATVALAPRRRTMFGRSGGSRAGTLVALLAVTAIDLYCAEGLRRERLQRQARPHDWSGRSGYPKGMEASRGAARDLQVPDDMRTPEALRPWTEGGRPGG